MSISVLQTKVGSANSNHATPQKFQFPNNTGRGNTIIIAYGVGNNKIGSAISSITDTSSNTYARATLKTNSEITEIWYAANITPGTTPVVTINETSVGTAGRSAYILREYTGIGGPGVEIDGTAGVGNTGTLINSGTITTANAMDLLITSSYSQFTTTGWLFDATFTNGTKVADGGATGGLAMEDKSVTSTGNYFGTFIGSASGVWAADIAGFNVGTGIQFDAAGSVTVSSGSIASWAHTITGNNTLLLAAFNLSVLAGTMLPPKFAGATMTKIISANDSAGTAELWYLVNPATGLGTINGTTSTGGNKIIANSVSFTGVDQTTPIAGSAGTTFSIATSGSINLTTTGDMNWIAGQVGYNDVTGTDDTVTGQVRRSFGSQTGQVGIMSTNGPVSPTGTAALRWTFAASTGQIILAEINAIQAAPATSNTTFKTLLGAGNI